MLHSLPLTVFARVEADGVVGGILFPQHRPDQWHRLQSRTKHQQTWNVALDPVHTHTHTVAL